MAPNRSYMVDHTETLPMYSIKKKQNHYKQIPKQSGFMDHTLDRETTIEQ